jgi:hypothetical protein
MRFDPGQRRVLDLFAALQFTPRSSSALKASCFQRCTSLRRYYDRRMATPKKTTTRKVNPALMKPVQPDEALSKIVGSKPLPRGELTKKLWDYIKKNKLQDEKKRTQINADDALKVVFNGKKSVTMFEMTKLVSGHVKA